MTLAAAKDGGFDDWLGSSLSWPCLDEHIALKDVSRRGLAELGTLPAKYGQVIDLHFHHDLYPDAVATMKECIERQLFGLSVTSTPFAWSGTAPLAMEAPRIRTAIGLHPQIAQERQRELALFEELLPQSRYVGEIGWDGGPLGTSAGPPPGSPRSPAGVPVLDVLAFKAHADLAVLHWFSGSKNELQPRNRPGMLVQRGPGDVGWRERSRDGGNHASEPGIHGNGRTVCAGESVRGSIAFSGPANLRSSGGAWGTNGQRFRPEICGCIVKCLLNGALRLQR